MDAVLYALSFLSRKAKKQVRENPEELIRKLSKISLFKREEWKFRTKTSKKNQSVRYILESDITLKITLYKSCAVLRFSYLNSDLFHKDQAPEYEAFGLDYEYRADILKVIRLLGGDELIFASKTEYSGSDILIKMAKNGSSYREIKSFITDSGFSLTKNLHKVFRSYFSSNKTEEFIYDDFEVVKNPKFINHKENIKKTENISELIYTGHKLIEMGRHPVEAFIYMYEAERRILVNCIDRAWWDVPAFYSWENLNEFYAEYNKKNGTYHCFAFTEAYWETFFFSIEKELDRLARADEWEYLSLLFNNLQFRRKFSRFYWYYKDNFEACRNFKK